MNLAAHRRIWLIAALMALTSSAIGSTFVFIPQWDNILSATNYSWSAAANWFNLDGSGNLVPAGSVPHQDDNAIITSLVDAGGTGFRVKDLLLTNNAVVSNGTFSVSALQMLSASSFQNATNNILISLNVGGTNCTLIGSVMDVLSTAYATFVPVAPATASTLTLTQSSVLQNSGTVTLAGGSEITLAQGSVLLDYGTVMLAESSRIIAGNGTQSTLIIEPGAVLSSTDLTYIEGSIAGPLSVDNSGLIRVDGGTLTFDNGINWECSAGIGEFRAAATNSLVMFASGFHADSGTTSLFTGPGTNRWLVGGSIDGTAQVGALDPSSGNLEILSSCSGFGSLHVLGSPPQTTVLSWSNGTLSLAAINVDANGTMLIGGGAGTSRQLSGCMLNNSGTCSVSSGDVMLAQASVLDNLGRLYLNNSTRIISGNLPQSGILIEPGAVLSATNLTSIEGSAAGHLIVDNSGLIRVDGGTLSLDNGIDWECSAGTGEFRAAATNSLVLFASGFHADSGTTSFFTGPGTNRWPVGGTIDGTAQVGAVDPNTSAFSTGNLEVLSSCIGIGSVHVLGSPAQTALLNWNNGTLSLAAINVDTNATLLISGGAGTSRQLSGCVLNNRGLCELLSPDLGLSLGAAINNLAGGMFELLADGTFSGSPAPAGGAFNNTGTLRKSTSGTTQFQAPDFNNAGLVDVVSGQLNLMGGISSGRFQTEAGAVLWFWGGTHTLGTGASFTGPGSVRLYQGASAPQWLVNGSVSAVELELGTNGLLVGTTSTSGNPVTIGTLIVSANGSISNGTYAVQDAEMRDESTFIGLTMNLISNLFVGGTNCFLVNSTLQISIPASATFAPLSPATESTLILAQGSVLWNSGRLFLNGGSKITSGSLPQSGIIIDQGAVLSSSNLTSIEGSAAGHLIVDNSGLIRVDGGTLRFDNGIDWVCSVRTGEFRAASTNSLILFASGFHADGGTTSSFTGPGTNRWPGGGTIDGTAQVGAVDPNTSAFSTGNLEILSSCSGLGGMHVLGSLAQTAVLNWNNGTLSLAAINVDANATMLISGGAGTSRQLSGCALNNQGNILLRNQATITCGNGATLRNLPSGTLDIQTDAALTFSNAGPMLVISNSGRFVKSAGTQTSLIAANLNNSGTIEVKAGTLQFQGSWSQTTGSTTVDGGAVLGGTLLSIGGGTLTGTGTIQATVVNDGVASPGGSPGTLSLGPSENYQQGVSGILQIELGGHNPGTQYDQLVVGGNASLAGTLELRLINGFVPQPGDQFQVLTCGSQAGPFSQINAPAVGGNVWVAHYSGTSVSVVLANQVKIAQPVLSGGKLSFSFNTTAGLSYVLQESDSLNPPSWQTLEEVIGDGGSKTISDPATEPQHFYRVLIQ
jgi:hypothetical protein